MLSDDGNGAGVSLLGLLVVLVDSTARAWAIAEVRPSSMREDCQTLVRASLLLALLVLPAAPYVLPGVDKPLR